MRQRTSRKSAYIREDSLDRNRSRFYLIWFHLASDVAWRPPFQTGSSQLYRLPLLHHSAFISTMNPTTFPDIRKLPIELQLQIWTYAASPQGGLQLTDRLLLDKEIYAQMICNPDGIGCYLRVLAVDYMSYYMSPEAEV